MVYVRKNRISFVKELKIHISINAPINSVSYGIVSLNILRELNKRHKVSLFPIGGFEVEQQDVQLINDTLKNAEEFDYNSPCLRIFHQHALHEMPRCSERIGYPIFELDTFTAREKHSLMSCDKLVVASHWAKDICEKNGINIPISVAPLGVNSEFSATPFREDKFVVGNIGKWEFRKGHDLIPLIFAEALGEFDDVELHMLAHNRFAGPEINKEWEDYYKSKLGNKVVFHGRYDQHSSIPQVINNCHVGLYPSRAEGWNMPALETLACGRHLIINNYSASTEFANKDNAFLVQPSGMEVAEDGFFFQSGIGYWSTIDYKPYVDILRQLYLDWRKGAFNINTNGIETSKLLSWANTVDKIEKVWNYSL